MNREQTNRFLQEKQQEISSMSFAEASELLQLQLNRHGDADFQKKINIIGPHNDWYFAVAQMLLSRIEQLQLDAAVCGVQYAHGEGQLMHMPV